MVRAAPPGVDSASSTWTCIPAWARTMAAASPLGPAPMTHALRFITYHLERPALVWMLARSDKHYCCCTAAGHSATTMVPSGSRSRVGAYSPNSCRRHHIPVARFSAMLVNQYCQSTARICRGGSCGKGLPGFEDSSGLALPVAEVAHEQGKVLWNHGGSSDEILNRGCRIWSARPRLRVTICATFRA